MLCCNTIAIILKKNISKRIVWARTDRHWKQTEWLQVIFTDESSFLVRPKKNGLYIRRRWGQRQRQQYIVMTVKFGYQSVSVWSGFSIHGRLQLVGTVGSFDRHTYRVIIDDHILPFIYNVHNGPASCIFKKTTVDRIEPNPLLLI